MVLLMFRWSKVSTTISGVPFEALTQSLWSWAGHQIWERGRIRLYGKMTQQELIGCWVQEARAAKAQKIEPQVPRFLLSFPFNKKAWMCVWVFDFWPLTKRYPSIFFSERVFPRVRFCSDLQWFPDVFCTISDICAEVLYAFSGVCAEVTVFEAFSERLHRKKPKKTKKNNYPEVWGF